MQHWPLVHILDQHQVNQSFQNPLTIALQGRAAKERSRAELELRKAVKALSILTGGSLNDPAILAALSLPPGTVPIVWAAHMLFNKSLKEVEGDRYIQQRDRDCQMILKALEQIDLEHWYQSLIRSVPYAAIPTTMQFPPSHPQPSRFYRQHPLSSRPETYYPVDSYFLRLFEERKRESIEILAALGAASITFKPCLTSEDEPFSAIALTHEEVYKYPGKPWSPNLTFNPQGCDWLAYQPKLQALIDSRLRHGLQSATFEITLDLDNMLTSHIQNIELFLGQIESLSPKAMGHLLKQSLRPETVVVEFGT